MVLTRPQHQRAGRHHYGADARGEASWSVPADPRYTYPDFEALMDQTARVVEGYDVALRAIAKKVATEVRRLY